MGSFVAPLLKSDFFFYTSTYLFLKSEIKLNTEISEIL